MTNTKSSDSWDLVIVGAGGTGLMAALTAARLGKKVVLLEKEAQLGGSTALSFGVFTTSGTPHQRAEGIVDTPDATFIAAKDKANEVQKIVKKLQILDR